MTDVGDMAQFNRALIEQYRASGAEGSLGPVTFARLLLLTTTGRRSGRSHTVPIGFVPDEDGSLLLFASNMGAPDHPHWYLNLVANPHVTVEAPGGRFETDAVVLAGAERDCAYESWVEASPPVAEHQQRAGRQIPMVQLSRPG